MISANLELLGKGRNRSGKHLSCQKLMATLCPPMSVEVKLPVEAMPTVPAHLGLLPRVGLLMSKEAEVKPKPKEWLLFRLH